MSRKNRGVKNEKGFSILELVVTIAVIGVMASIAIPSFSSWIPNYRLRNAAMDLHSNLQLAKMQAIRDNSTCSIEFDEEAQSYQLRDNADTEIKTVNLASYGSDITFGHGPAPTGEDIEYEGSRVTFDSQGMGQSGYIYLENKKKDRCFRVGSMLTGIIRLEKWDGSDWD